jgi:hypothetical protein
MYEMVSTIRGPTGSRSRLGQAQLGTSLTAVVQQERHQLTDAFLSDSVSDRSAGFFRGDQTRLRELLQVEGKGRLWQFETTGQITGDDSLLPFPNQSAKDPHPGGLGDG